MIYIATDHAGFDIKKKLLSYFKENGIAVSDFGPHKLDPDDDYPDYALAVAEKVAGNKENKGILICRSGIGMTIAANKIRGVRAALCTDITQAQKSREHNDANILVLAADYTPVSKMENIISVFLQTEFSGLLRHQRRINKIAALEKRQ